MTTQLAIRPARAGDAAAIADIHVRSWEATYRGQMPDAILDAMTYDRRLSGWSGVLADASDRLCILVASDGDRVVGFASSYRMADGVTMRIEAIYLDPAVVGRGIGRALMAALETDAIGRDATAAELDVLAANSHARGFYEASGWSTDGVEIVDDRWPEPIVTIRYTKRLDEWSSESSRCR